MNQLPRRILPYSLEAEESVIGGILLSARCLALVAGLLTPADFYHPVLGAIYEAILDLDADSAPIDILTVGDRMRAKGSLVKLKGQGGEGYLAALANKIATVENIAHHAQMVRAKATIRRLIEAASTVVERGYAEQFTDVEHYYADAMALLDGAAGALGRSEAVPMRVLIHEAARRVEARYSRKEAITGLATRFSEFDEMTGGLQPGHLIVLAARPKIGKSAWAFQVAAQVQVPVYAFSLEMSRVTVADRAIIQEARIDGQRFASGFLNTHDWIRITPACARLVELPIEVDDGGGQTLAEIRAKARRWRSRLESSCQALIVVDYLQLAIGDRRGRHYSREQEIAEISRGLRNLAKELQVPVLALAQVNRDVDKRADKRPTLSDLRESGAIEADADLVCFLYRDEVYNKESPDQGIAELIIGANRHGPTGIVRLKWTGEYVRFDNLSHRDDAPSRPRSRHAREDD